MKTKPYIIYTRECLSVAPSIRETNQKGHLDLLKMTRNFLRGQKGQRLQDST